MAYCGMLAAWGARRAFWRLSTSHMSKHFQFSPPPKPKPKHHPTIYSNQNLLDRRHELFRSSDIDEVVGHLVCAAEQQVFAVAIGYQGAGKTTLIRRFTAELPTSKFLTLYLFDSKLTPRHFY